MNSKPVQISIVTATMNNSVTIDDCMLSIKSQDYPHIEHVLIDGGSSDDTVSRVTGKKLENSRIVCEPDKGLYDALNKGFRIASGEIIGILHGDDLFADDRVISRIAAAFNDPEIGAVYGDLHYVSENNTDRVIRKWKSREFTRDLLGKGWMPPHPTLFVRRSWLDKIGNFDLKFKIASDYHFILRLFSNPDLKTRYIPEVLVKMRVGGVSNKSLKNLVLKSREDLTILRSSGVGGVITLVRKNLSKTTQFI